MTGGIAYLYDPQDKLNGRLNGEFIDAQPVPEGRLAAQLKALLEQHHEQTGSEQAGQLLDDFVPTHFKLVKPKAISLEQLTLNLIGEDECIPVKESA